MKAKQAWLFRAKEKPQPRHITIWDLGGIGDPLRYLVRIRRYSTRVKARSIKLSATPRIAGHAIEQPPVSSAGDGQEKKWLPKTARRIQPASLPLEARDYVYALYAATYGPPPALEKKPIKPGGGRKKLAPRGGNLDRNSS